MRKKDDVLEIGVLNLMHDKEDTKRRFERVLTREDRRVNLTWFYPVMHYQDREVPENVRQMSQPLDLDKVKGLDAFIVTGAPLEKLDFDDVTYISELQELFDCLSTEGIEQLYVCWGAMVAANYFYGVDKYLLNQKLFGVYPQVILENSPLLEGLSDGFLAPHARYAELSCSQVREVPELSVVSVSETNHLFLAEARKERQTFLFSHLEYGRDALDKEYYRELQAHPEDAPVLAKAANYYDDQVKMTGMRFGWGKAQRHFFENWLKQAEENRLKKVCTQ